MRAASTAWMLDGRLSADSGPTATSCSMNSGLPSAVSTIRAAVCGPSDSGAVLSASASASSPESASSTTSDRPGCGVNQAGRSSARSGRARQRIRIGCPLEKATT